MKNYKAILLFLIATFSRTQIHVIGYIGISELVLFLVGPVTLVFQWKNLKRDGFMPLILLAILWVLSAISTDLFRHSLPEDMLRGVAAPISILMITPCLYVLLKDNLEIIKWGVIGFVATIFLSTFFIHTGGVLDMAEKAGLTAKDAALEYKLTILMLVNGVIGVIPKLYFMQWPRLSMCLAFGMSIFALFEGGRSAFLCILMGVAMMWYSRRRSLTKRLSFAPVLLLVVLSTIILFLAKEGYEYAAINGYLGDEEQKKYEIQSNSKIGLLSARSEFVAVYYAVKDSPLLGHGSWARDWKGYGLRAAEWLEDDIAIASFGRRDIPWIPGHSHIMTAYVWHGLLGAVFWVYIFWVVMNTLRFYLMTVPNLFGYFALTLPSLLWAIVFSPFSARIPTVFTIVLCLLAKRRFEILRRTVRLQGYRPGFNTLADFNVFQGL